MKNKKGVISALLLLICGGTFAYTKYSYSPAFTFEYSENETGITISKYKGFRSEVKVPEEIKGLPVTEIAPWAFSSCSAKEITLPESVSVIGNGAFSGTSIKSFVFPENVTDIADDTFYGCKQLESVVLPENAERIGREAFTLCESLESIDIPDSVTEIGSTAFTCASSLKSVNIPPNLEKVGNRIFYNTEFEKSIIGDGFTILGDDLLYLYQGDDAEVVLPDNVKYIAGGAFRDCPASSIDVSSAEYISDAAFSECKNLRKVSLSDNAELKGTYIFSYCTSLESITLPYDCSIDDWMFCGCTALRRIKLRGTPSYIGNGAFDECTSLENIDLPDSIKKIGDMAFIKSGITEIHIPDNVTEIPYECFFDCNKLVKIELSPDTKTIEKQAFENCTDMKDINIPEKVESIGERAFFESGIRKVILPDTLTSLGDLTFAKCSFLEELHLPSSLNMIPMGCFQECTSLKNVKIPEGCTDIGSNAFTECRSLFSVDLPESLKTIELNAFYNCDIPVVYIPDGLENFDGQSFLNFDRTTVLYLTENCKAAEQINEAQQHWIVHGGYKLVTVADRAEAEQKIYHNN